ncbi:MAG: hypothetical protein N3E38_01895, partial [Candidatus Aenigmarchaeota archaeon]|nr:hypothetical protein [Candidatus Aenigmarchaeota archaeon]
MENREIALQWVEINDPIKLACLLQYYDFVQIDFDSYHGYQQFYNSGWKIHVGIGLQSLTEIVYVLSRYPFTAKFAGLEILELWYGHDSIYRNQRGKDITIYIPYSFEGLIPILVLD